MWDSIGSVDFYIIAGSGEGGLYRDFFNTDRVSPRRGSKNVGVPPLTIYPQHRSSGVTPGGIRSEVGVRPLPCLCRQLARLLGWLLIMLQ